MSDSSFTRQRVRSSISIVAESLTENMDPLFDIASLLSLVSVIERKK